MPIWHFLRQLERCSMRKYIIAGGVLIATLAFSGCGAVPDGTIAWEQQSADSVVIENNHVKGELVENTVNIDADIEGIDKTDWKEYSVNVRKFEEDETMQISHILLGDDFYLKRAYESAASAVSDGSLVYNYEAGDGTKSVTVGSGRISLNSSKAIEQQYSSYFNPNGKILEDDALKEIFPKEYIDGVDRQESINQFKKLCEDMSIRISDNIRIYALDKDSANNVRKENEWLGRDKNGEYKPDVTAEDEVYCIIAPLQIEGVELPVSNTSSSTGSSSASVVMAIIGRNGLSYFTATGLYETKDEKEVTEIHNINEVLDYIKTNYQYLEGQNQKITFSNIELKYIARYYITDNLYKIIPTYVCTKDTTIVSEKDGERTERVNTEHLYIDAQNLTSFSGR